MGELFFDLPTTDSFMDDTIIHGYADFSTHLANVVEVLKRLLSVGMQVNPETENTKRMYATSSG